MDYSIMFFEECARCRQFEPVYKHKNCSFDVEHKDNITIQSFECTKCHFKWIREYNHESSIDNRPTLRRKTG
jgi:transposase-like protein